MDDFDEYDDFFEDDSEEDIPNEPEPEAEDPEDTCDGWCVGDGIEDFALIGGAIGYLEEEITERRRAEWEMERKLKREEEEENEYPEELY